MLRYQELMDSVMAGELYMAAYMINVAGQNKMSFAEMQMLFDSSGNFPVLNMLNTKYIIYSPEGAPIRINSALGNAWFVDSYSLAEDANQEILMMRKLNTASEAVIDKRFESELKGLKITPDSTAAIRLVEYKPNYLKYESQSAADGLVVFSEIYYSKGWQATIDGKPKQHFRANYVLRSIVVPKGKHTIEFRFDPQSYKTGNLISYICSGIIFLMIIASAVLFYIKRRKGTKTT